MAHATWIKMTFTGVLNESSSNLPGANTARPFTWSYMIMPYGINQASPQGSTQSSPEYGVGYNPPIVGFSSFVGTGLSGQYNSFGQPYATDELTFTNAVNSSINFTTGRIQSSGVSTSGVTYTFDAPNQAAITGVDAISLQGPLTAFNPGGQTSPDNTISGLISAAMSSNNQTVNCAGSCTGVLSTSDESALSFTWSQVQFESFTGVPSPLPVAGGASAFYFSRRLRRRIGSAKS